MNRTTLTLLVAGALAAAWPGVRLTAQPSASVPMPEVKAGPYRVVVDRLTHNRALMVNYRTDLPAREEPGIQSRRSVQLQLAVYAPDPARAAALMTFQVRGVTVDSGSRVVELSHYGGILEHPNDKAAVRAYLYIPAFPNAAREVRLLDGEIVAYERAAPVDLEVPLTGGRFPLVVEQGGIKATVRELTGQGGTVQITFRVEAPPETALVANTTDGTYGVTLYNAEGRAAGAVGGTLTQPQVNQSEYRLGFQNVRGAPARMTIRVLHRSGARRTYPFRLERIPVPVRPTSEAKPPSPAPPGAQNPQ